MMLEFGDEASRRVEETYMTDDVVEQRRAIRDTLALRAGERVLDIGSGPGFLSTEMAALVGPEGAVVGTDVSEAMLAIAARREADDGAASVDFVIAEANALPFPDESFDAVVSTQVYEYVPDMPAALAEAARVLRPRGRLLVLDTDWDSIVWRSGDDARMRRMLAAWDEHLADPHLPRRLGGLLEEAGLSVTQRAVFPILNAGYRRDTYSAGLIGFISAFVPGRHGLDGADVDAWSQDLLALGPDYFFSLNRYLFLAVK